MRTSIKNQIIDAVSKENASLRDISNKLFISEKQLRLLLKSWNVKLPRKREYRIVPMPEREELMKNYQKLKTTTNVSIRYGTSVNTVNKWMKQLNIPTRKMKMEEKAKIKFIEEHLDRLQKTEL